MFVEKVTDNDIKKFCHSLRAYVKYSKEMLIEEDRFLDNDIIIIRGVFQDNKIVNNEGVVLHKVPGKNRVSEEIKKYKLNNQPVVLFSYKELGLYQSKKTNNYLFDFNFISEDSYVSKNKKGQEFLAEIFDNQYKETLAKHQKDFGMNE